ncbi:uncharacterized protein LOC110725963 [Chenopodium quinoa]|uniref:uncharacterized protein LOC110725963 n=1 Tax=Chenopodium quinoa TaxID=63459 RepID=UPI000B789A7A|nr:uncharacterized protein LOC110725963 [Chenopodium quinoa]XP_021761132.1 uncharacterized protein LOC110725963 [Chenopodium quinoa]
MLFYFDRVQRLDKRPPRTFSIISVWNRHMVLERLKIEYELGFGRGKILPRIAVQVEESPEVFMNDFVSLVKETSTNLSRLSGKLMKAKEIFPENHLVRKVDEVLGRMATREQSTLSQDEEFYESEEFLNAIAQIEKDLMEAANFIKTTNWKENYDVRKAFTLHLTPPSPAIGTGSTSTTKALILEPPIQASTSASIGKADEKKYIPEEKNVASGTKEAEKAVKESSNSGEKKCSLCYKNI